MKAYISNLNYVLPHITELIRQLNGTSVITSDHGEACGEPATFLNIPIYGHPAGVKIPVLLQVPWFVVENKNSKIKNKNLSNLKSKISKLKEKMNKKL